MRDWIQCRRWTGAVLAGWLALPSTGWACATCFGASDSKMAEGMNMGILTLLMVVAGVLGSILTAGIVLVVRSRQAGEERSAGVESAASDCPPES